MKLIRRHQTRDFVNTPLLRLQSLEGEFATSREIEPVRRSFRSHEVARLRKWHVWCLLEGAIA